jgi:gluconolactonase
MARLGRIVEIDPRGIIVGFVPIPNGDMLTTNFAFGGPDNQYVYFEGAIDARRPLCCLSG